MKNKIYGIPYMGSKNQIVKDLCEFILSRHDNKKYFIDACCGGLAVSDYVLNNSKMNVIANDLDADLINLYRFFTASKENRKAINDYILSHNSKLCFKIIKEEYYNNYENLDDKTKIFYKALLINNSFGNVQKTFLWGDDSNKKKQLLSLCVLNDFKSVDDFKNEIKKDKDLFNDFDNNFDFFESDTGKTILDFYFNYLSDDIKKIKYYDNGIINNGKRLAFKKSLVKYFKENILWKKGKERLEQLEQLERLQQLQQLQRLERLQQLQQLERLQFKNMDLFELIKSFPLDILKYSIIYIDPPYKNKGEYKEKPNNDFYTKLTTFVKEYQDICPIYISSYEWEGLKEVWSIRKTILIGKNINRKVKQEKLFYNDYKEVNEITLFDYLEDL